MTRHLPSTDLTRRAANRRQAHRGWRSLALLAAAGAISGCASSNLDAQWVDPQLSSKSLAGAKVYVACQAVDLTVRRVCADELAAQVRSAGATPLLAADSADPVDTAQPANPGMLDAARAAGASVVLNAVVAPDASIVSSGPSIGIGIGGFGGGYRGGAGGGLGVSVPVGGGSVSTGYAANGSITDVASGRLVWSAKATAQPSSNVGEQMANLAQALLDSARGFGLFKT
ncbi:MAG: hypothetical protein ABIR94_23465 [Rubrivivax sp.]